MPANSSFNQLPSALTPLKSQHRWVNWRFEIRKGKRTKVPYQPSGVLAETDNEKTWSTFEAVAQINGYDGVGFCLKDSEIAAFDIDDCREPSTGRVHPWAMRKVEQAGSYAEITPSGTGLRIIGYGKGPHLHRKLTVTDGVSCELYRKATRYMTVSGVAFNDKPLVDIDAAIDATLAELDRKGGADNEGDADKDEAKTIPNYLASLLHIQGTGAYKTRSELLFAFITGALRAGVGKAAIIKACIDTVYIGCGIYEHVKENGGEPYVERQIEHARDKVAENTGTSEPLEFIDIADWDANPAPPRPWAVKDYVPLRQPTLLSGDGGMGKTILLLQWCVAAVLTQEWIGLTPTPGPVIYIGTEDEADELHRMLDRIIKFYGEPSYAAIKDRLFITSYASKENAILARFDHHGILRPTKLYQDLFTKACDIKPVLICLDTVSDVFAGNEIDRAQVSAFLGLLRRLAIASNSAVIIAAHPSLQGMSSGSGLSGSTAWHAKVKSRMYFKAAATNDKGDDIDQDLRVLEFHKNNYGKINASIELRWTDGLYLPEPSFNEFDQTIANHRIDDAFVNLIRRFTAEGRTVSSNPGKNYAPAVFVNEPEMKAIRATKAKLVDAMQRLFLAERIREGTYGSPSRMRSRLEVATP
jgi:RecA-family ATPase